MCGGSGAAYWSDTYRYVGSGEKSIAPVLQGDEVSSGLIAQQQDSRAGTRDTSSGKYNGLVLCQSEPTKELLSHNTVDPRRVMSKGLMYQCYYRVTVKLNYIGGWRTLCATV